MPISKTLSSGLLLSTALLGAVPVLAATTIREFVVPANPFALTAGADGAVWFTITDGTALGRVAADGTFKLVNLPAPSVPIENTGLLGITLAPDGSLWAAAPLRESIFRLSRRRNHAILDTKPLPL